MNDLHLILPDERAAFAPGEVLEGAAGWRLDEPPSSMEARLFWFTRGKGTEDVGVVEVFQFESPQLQEKRTFRFQLPGAPYSFSGKLISLIWAVELVALPSNASTRVEFVLAPGGREIELPELPKFKRSFGLG